MKKAELLKRAKEIRAIIVDVDGVLTDGRIIYSSGGAETKYFYVQDGLACELARRAGIKIFLVTGRSSEVVIKRGVELKAECLWEGVGDKGPIFDIIRKDHGLEGKHICSVGDDLLDLKLFSRSGLAVAVPNAVEEVRRAASYITKRPGGHGALREVVEFILKAQGKWKDLIDGYYE